MVHYDRPMTSSSDFMLAYTCMPYLVKKLICILQLLTPVNLILINHLGTAAVVLIQ